MVGLCPKPAGFDAIMRLNMEVSFTSEIESLRLGEGETFHGEGILAITKALLESGVAYVGGYQGAPVSHLLDVMVQARDLMGELGVHVEACANEASAAAMLGASIHYPLRGAVTWKSIVGTNVAADALSNLSSPGVRGGVLAIIGEDYGEGASVIQERTHAYALKSCMCLLDPRPHLPKMVEMVRHGFELSEASNMPVLLELRIRACHVRGSFPARNNQASPISTQQRMVEAAPFDYSKLAHPPVTFPQEVKKVNERLPAAQAFIEAHGLNETFEGTDQRLGLLVQGGLYNTLIRVLQQLGLADARGHSVLPIHVLNVTYPLVPVALERFCEGKQHLLVIEEGQPEYIEQDLALMLMRRRIDIQLHGKDVLPRAGEYTAEVLATGLLKLLQAIAPDLGDQAGVAQWLHGLREQRAQVAQALRTQPHPLPARPPSFCIGCPERPVFSAIELAKQALGPIHVAADIGCHALGTFEPFHTGHTILGYGMSLASRAGVSPNLQPRVLSLMGDGGFWHNGLLTGVQSALFNGDDAVLVIFKNGYTSATGTQDIVSTPSEQAKQAATDKAQSLAHTNTTIEQTLKGLGVKWLRTVSSYSVAQMNATLLEAFHTPFKGLKVIVAEGECQLERQRRLKPWQAQQLAQGERVSRVKFGIDEDVCSGDHACMRLSGCPSLTLKDNPDPLKTDPVATVLDTCVGCGLCGENAHAAALCPSFYRAEVVHHPGWWESAWHHTRQRLVRWLQTA